MTKICGYSCPHNKGGICQITGCIYKIVITTTIKGECKDG